MSSHERQQAPAATPPNQPHRARQQAEAMKHYYPLALLLALASCHTAKPLQQQVPHETISRWQPAPPPATYLIPTTDSAQAPAYEAMPDSLPFVKVLRLKLPQIKSFKVFKPF